MQNADDAGYGGAANGPTPPAPAEPSRHQANILTRAVRGAFWTILSGTGARVFGILGTLAVTHYLTPDEYGEVSLAALVTLTATCITNCGVSQYIASKPGAGRAAVFHATFYYLLLGVVSLGGAVLFGGPFSYLISAPNIGKYLPLLALATFVERICLLQDRIMLRDMRFRAVGILRSAGELTYAVVSVVLAAACAGTPFGGGNALVWATVARALVRLFAFSATTSWREWAEPHPITRAQTREFFSFGLPMWLASIANFGSSKFDNFVYSHHFGEGAVGQYNVTYNFADMPAALIAETVGDVLTPSFAHMADDASRKESFLLALRTLVFLVTPMAFGLGMVAPELVRFALPASYEGSIPILRILALLAVPRTIGWTAVSFLQVHRDPRIIMILEWARMFGIVVFMHLITVVARRLFGHDVAVAAACSAVVLVFALSALSYMVAIRSLEGVSLVGQILPLLPPLLACAPMLLAVYGIRHVLDNIEVFAYYPPLLTFGARARVFGPRLVIEIAVGVAAFVPSALILAPASSRKLVEMVRGAIQRRRGQPSPA